MMLLTWYEKLFFDVYKYELVYTPGTRNILPDAISRLYTSNEADGADKLDKCNRFNNKSIIMVKEEKKRKSAPGSLATQYSLAKLKSANRMQFKRKPKYNNSNQLQLSFDVLTKLDAHYFSKKLNDDDKVDIFDASTTYNMPFVRVKS